jgi:hypothetical protein
MLPFCQCFTLWLWVRAMEIIDSMLFVTGMKMSASPVPLAARSWWGAGGRDTVRPSGTGAPGVKQGGQAGLAEWAESPC